MVNKRFVILSYICLSGICVPDRLLAKRSILRDPAHQEVNKKVSIGHYEPHDIIRFEGVRVAARIVPDLKRLIKAAAQDGITLKVKSGYRSYDDQVRLFKRYTKKELKRHSGISWATAEETVNTYCARPGHSEHQLGTTVDILSSENGYQFSADKSLKYVQWLEKNATRFNFKISHHDGNSEYIYEPWHLRWFPSEDR